MKYLSVCSGIEAATVAWEPLGWEALAFSEIEAFPSAVLAHHWPDVPNLGDFTTIQRDDLPALPDVLIGGTPCQAFSVAGLRESLNDDRGNLTLEFVRLADRLDDGQLIVLWENVPGVLNTADNAFGAFLGGLVGANTALVPPGGKRWGNAGMVDGPARRAAWRILDAQYFGVAQRRRRVFVVASAREGFDPAAVLLECDSVRRHSAPSRQPREGAAASTPSGTDSGSPIVIDRAAYNQGINAQYTAHIEACEVMDPLVARGPHAVCMASGQARAEIVHDGSPTLTTQHDGPPIVMAPAFSKRPGQQIATRQDDMSYELTTGEPPRVVEPHAFRKSARARTSPDNGGYETWVDDGAANTLNCFDVGERDTHAIVEPLAFDGYNQTLSKTAQTIRADKSDGDHVGMVFHTAAVRRLTPTECERLQGFPDGHTAIPWRKKPAEDCPDGPRYKACGNSMAVPVIRWIGKRIDNEAR